MNTKAIYILLALFTAQPLFAENFEDAAEKGDDSSAKSGSWKSESLAAAGAEFATGQFIKGSLHMAQAAVAADAEKRNAAIADKARQEDAVNGTLGVGQTRVITIGRDVPAGPITANPGMAPSFGNWQFAAGAAPAPASSPSAPRPAAVLPDSETPDLLALAAGSATGDYAPPTVVAAAPSPSPTTAQDFRSPASLPSSPAEAPKASSYSYDSDRGMVAPSAGVAETPSGSSMDANVAPMAASVSPLTDPLLMLDALTKETLGNTADASEPRKAEKPKDKAKTRRPRTLH